MQDKVTIQGREYTIAARHDGQLAGTAYTLVGARGAAYLAVPAYVGDAHTYKVLGGRSFSELRIHGNAVRLTDATGELVEVAR